MKKQPLHQSPVAIKNVAGFMEMTVRLLQRGPLQPGFGVCYGPSGYGKTMASIFAQNKTRAIRIEVGETWTRRTILTALLRELGADFRKKATLSDLAEQAIAALGDDPTRPLLVDEADKLVDKGHVELLRELQEASTAPVIMIGEEKLPTKLLQVERVHNRVLAWHAAQPCDLEDTRALAGVFAPGLTLDDDLLDRIRQRSAGRARRIGNNLSNVAEYARNRNIRALNLSQWGGQPFDTGEPPKRDHAIEMFARKNEAAA